MDTHHTPSAQRGNTITEAPAQGFTYHVDSSGVVISQRERDEQQGTDIPGTLADEREFASLKAFVARSERELATVSKLVFGSDGFPI
jgi:hypothetical protein